MAKKDNSPIIEGLSFNLFAIFTFLILLPVATAFITNLAGVPARDYESLTAENQQQIDSEGNTVEYVNWLDKGDNMTDTYEEIYQIGDPMAYASIWDESSPLYRKSVVGQSNPYFNGDIYLIGLQNHRYLGGTNFQTPTSAVDWQGYFGYSGDAFSFLVEKNYTRFLDSSQDIKALRFEFVDAFNAYDCDNIIVNQEVNFTGDITFMNDFTTLSFTNFDFEITNKARNNYAFAAGQTQQTRCSVSMIIDFSLSPFEAIKFSENFPNYDNLTIQIDLYNFDNLNVFDSTYSNPVISTIPITGDNFYVFDLEVAYVDTVRTNFILNGFTLVLGIVCFAIALANTEYWNPVTDFFKEGVN